MIEEYTASSTAAAAAAQLWPDKLGHAYCMLLQHTRGPNAGRSEV
jgi:hypothetical protein